MIICAADYSKLSSAFCNVLTPALQIVQKMENAGVVGDIVEDSMNEHIEIIITLLTDAFAAGAFDISSSKICATTAMAFHPDLSTKFHTPLNRESGRYYLYQYRALCTNSDRSLSALWGKLAAEILMQNWDIALEELNRLKEIIDSKSFSSPLNQVQSRIWLMHWSLFIFFNHENGRTQIIDLFNQDKYLNAIQTNAPHLLRYLATAFIVNKRRRPQFKEFIKVIQQERYSNEDPITEFLACIYVNYDFDMAQKKMRECEEVILNDPFLGKRVEEGNFSTVPLRDEFLENARLFIFETYCRIHQRIDMGVLAEKLNLNYEEAERWIVTLIRTSKLEAKIDSKMGTIVMEPNQTNVYEQLIDHTKSLSGRTYKLVNQLLEHAQAQAAR
ncbi:UNVERIFIED_CONTAM: Eukaryotic translation initiation factor 3 subunit E [Sesamum radiatum]|uniref:Eukaryotic translation initiation factor 3 subunit E n=1 Tax=Sesamum radiatum TaxID=300843 RepID=A0AAW2I7C3_SESRA